MSGSDPRPTISDTELIESARSGDTSAFAELWRRHFRPAARVARQFTSIDADDLVSEAYARIFQRVLAGGGPTGAFRPYLYTTIRNLASSWGAASREVQVDLIEEFEDERIPEDPAAHALDRTLTARAFRSLPERWQTVLWYTEVEGMDPHEVAPIMGISANSVAALSYRAREGLRKAWLQAHINDATASGECQWTMSRLGDHTREGLSARDESRVMAHLADCASCTIVAEEVEEVGSHLAMVMLPLLLGGIAGGTLLSQLSEPSGAMAADLAGQAIPALPESVEAIATGGAAAGTALVGAFSLGSLTGTGALVGGLAVATVLGTGIAVGTLPTGDDPGDSAPPVVAESGDDVIRAVGTLDPVLDPGPEGPSPSDLPDGGAGGAGGGAGGVVGGVTDTVTGTVGAVGDTVGGVVDVVDDTVQDVVETVTQPVTLTVSVSGTGTPGASVALKAAGTVYATTTVGQNGTFSITAGGIPEAVGNISVVQTVDQGLLGGLLGALLKPLKIGSSSGGLPVIAIG
ncbi:MAG: sigma-70 family RNA polymerase sigma factor [Schumannella sp.]